MIREWRRVSHRERDIVTPYLTSAPVKIAAIARALGVEVRSATLKPRISGELKKSETSESGYRIRVNRHEAPVRQRFTIAHEVGHFLLHRDLIGDGIEDNILYRSSLSNQIEIEANRMAAELLMPRGLILPYVEQCGGRISDDLVLRLSEDFEVSEAAMRIRVGMYSGGE